MSTYTTNFYEVMGGDVSDENVEAVRQKFFNFDYNFYSQDKRVELETKFINHFIMAEFGQETPALFRMYTRNFFKEYGPYYSDLYEATEKLDPYKNAGWKKTFEWKSNSNSDHADNVTTRGDINTDTIYGKKSVNKGSVNTDNTGDKTRVLDTTSTDNHTGNDKHFKTGNVTSKDSGSTTATFDGSDTNTNTLNLNNTRTGSEVDNGNGSSNGSSSSRKDTSQTGSTTTDVGDRVHVEYAYPTGTNINTGSAGDNNGGGDTLFGTRLGHQLTGGTNGTVDKGYSTTESMNGRATHENDGSSNNASNNSTNVKEYRNVNDKQTGTSRVDGKSNNTNKTDVDLSKTDTYNTSDTDQFNSKNVISETGNVKDIDNLHEARIVANNQSDSGTDKHNTNTDMERESKGNGKVETKEDYSESIEGLDESMSNLFNQYKRARMNLDSQFFRDARDYGLFMEVY